MPAYSCKTIKGDLFDIEGDGPESSVSAPPPSAARRPRRPTPAARAPLCRGAAPLTGPALRAVAFLAPPRPAPPRPRALPLRPRGAPPQVAAFKALVAQNRACDVSALKLICGGKVLRDEDSLDKAGVKDKAAGGFIVVMISAPKVGVSACASAPSVRAVRDVSDVSAPHAELARA